MSTDNDLRCHMRMCSERLYNMLTCTESVILVDNVTSSGSAQSNAIGLLNLQRMCMGKQQCSIQSLCDFGQKGGSYVHYYCVKVSAIDQKCSKTTRRLENIQGFLQSPKYPSLDFYSKCTWRISVLEGQQVLVELLDIQSTHGGCVDELTIYYTECANSPRAADKRCLAGGRRVPVAFLACGQVDIELRAGRQVRFWISYRVQDRSGYANYDNIISNYDDVIRLHRSNYNGLVNECGPVTSRTELTLLPTTYPLETSSISVNSTAASPDFDDVTVGDMHSNSNIAASPDFDDVTVGDMHSNSNIGLIVALGTACCIIILLLLVGVLLYRRQRRLFRPRAADQALRDRRVVKPNPSLPMKPGGRPPAGRPPAPTLLDTYGHVSDDISPHKQHLYDTIPLYGHKAIDPSIPLYAEVEDHPVVVMAPANTSKNPEK